MFRKVISRVGVGITTIGLVSAGLGGSAMAATPPSNPSYMTLSSYYGHPGERFTVMGHSFGADENIVVTFDNHTYSAKSDSSGNFNRQINVPYATSNDYQVMAKGKQYNESATANYRIASFNGQATPSSYYVLPGQMMSVSGTMFAPNEKVSIVNNTANNYSVATARTDANGNFTSANFNVDYNQSNSTQHYTVTGTRSGSMSSFNVSVGAYYAQLSPSTYYVTKGSSFSASGTNFAPNEQVRIFENGMMVTIVGTDANGNFNTVSLPVPASGTSFMLTATGMMSGATASQTISVER